MADRFGRNPIKPRSNSDPASYGYRPELDPDFNPPPPAPPPPAEPPPAGNSPYAENSEEYIIKDLASRPWVPEPAMRDGQQVFYASKNKGNITGVENPQPASPTGIGPQPAPDAIQAMLAASRKKPSWALDGGDYRRALPRPHKTHPLDPGTYDPFEGFTGPKTLAEAGQTGRGAGIFLTPEFKQYLQDSGYSIDETPTTIDAGTIIYNPQGQKVSMKDWPRTSPRRDLTREEIYGQQIYNQLLEGYTGPVTQNDIEWEGLRGQGYTKQFLDYAKQQGYEFRQTPGLMDAPGTNFVPIGTPADAPGPAFWNIVPIGTPFVPIPAPDAIQTMLAASRKKPSWALDGGDYKTHPLDPGTYNPFEGFTGPKTLAEANPDSRPVPGLTPEFEEYLQESGYTIDKRPLVADANPNIYNPQGQKVSMKDWGSYSAPAPRPDVPQLLGVPGQQAQSALASNRPAPDAIRTMLAASLEKPPWALRGRRT